MCTFSIFVPDKNITHSLESLYHDFLNKLNLIADTVAPDALETLFK